MKKRKMIACSNGKTYKNVREAEKDVGGYTSKCISRCLQGKQHTAYGLRWHYEMVEVEK